MQWSTGELDIAICRDVFVHNIGRTRQSHMALGASVGAARLSVLRMPSPTYIERLRSSRDVQAKLKCLGAPGFANAKDQLTPAAFKIRLKVKSQFLEYT